MNQREVAQKYRSFVKDIKWQRPLAVSLVPQIITRTDAGYFRITEYELCETTRCFVNRLRRRFFGHKRSADFQRLIIVEHSPILHLHCIVEAPMHLMDDDVRGIIVSEWSKLRWGTNNVHIEFVNSDRWINYIMKRRSKNRSVQDCIDLQNSQFISASSNALGVLEER